MTYTPQEAKMSAHFMSRKPSAIRLAQIEFAKRTDDTTAINTAIGNVSLPMHPAMIKRMSDVMADYSPFKDGVNKYTPTVGLDECNKAFLNVIASSGFDTSKLYSQITDGGSHGMELAILGVCGPAGTSEKPLLLIDAAYTNYKAFANRVGRETISVTRDLQPDGKFSLPDIAEIEKVIQEHKPGAMVIIPYDNPTGHYIHKDVMITLGKLCAKYGLWMISDEAYREFHYVKEEPSSVWGLTNETVPGIEGRRISIETASKVWNACGLRIGALVTDNHNFHTASVAEATANLCSNNLGQFIFGALAHESHEDLQVWYKRQRDYYFKMISETTAELKERTSGLIVSNPDASIYSVVDVRDVVKPGFDSLEFVKYCATQGKVDIDGKSYTLLVAPMAGFYSVKDGEHNPGVTQMRIAYIVSPEDIKLVPTLFGELLKQYELSR